MPAIVRGGKRQGQTSRLVAMSSGNMSSGSMSSGGSSSGASKSSSAAKATRVGQSSNTKTGTKTGQAPRRQAQSRGPRGKAALIGNVPLPNELVGWLVFLVIALLLSVTLLTGGRAQILSKSVVAFADNRLAGIGLNLQNVAFNKDLSGVAKADIKKALMPLNFKRGRAIALMDLNEVKAEVEKVGWVKSAVIRRQLPSQLIIEVVERPRIAVWQFQQKTYVIDDKGQIIPEAKAYNFNDLPLVVGEGANEQAAELLDLLRLHPQILPRIDALVRVDTRRWDLRIKNGTIVKLPALNQDQALERLDDLIGKKRILDQGLEFIDLRMQGVTVVTPFVN